ncbi:PE family protein [Mycobacterium sp.]|uniref:PE family protein n=1 Tax=Mycobacterium sp. TaxID=1785 RepID=UPI0025E60274|nr:PE family protein [Mycobacterium sp.]MBW0013286.1 PE family protein [Mycobacterium sp.]
MSSVTVVPEYVKAAAGDLAHIGSTLGQANAAAATPTTSIAAAAADEISSEIAAMFGTYGQHYQALSAQAAAFHNEFVGLLNGGAASYISAEIANAQQTLQGAIGGPAATAANLGANLPLLGGVPTPSLPALPTPPTVGGLTGLTSGLSGLTSGFNPSALTGLTSGFNPSALTGLTSGLSGLGSGFNPSALTGLTSGLASLPGQLGSGSSSLQSLLAGFFAAPSSGPFGQPPTGGPGVFPNPYLALIQNTQTNLSLLNAAWAADPFPIATQIMINQSHYAQVLQSQIAFDLQGFPANVPANIQLALQGASTFNPAAIGQTFVNGANSYWGPAIAGLQRLPMDFAAVMPKVQQDLGMMSQALSVGNYHLAVQDAAHAVLDSFISGFDLSHLTATLGTPVLGLNPLITLPVAIAGPILLLGPAADLLPLVNGIGQQAQGLASLVPAGSIAGQEIRNFANGISALTNTNVTANFNANVGVGSITLLPPSFTLAGLTIGGSAMFGLPLQLGFAALGSPFAMLDGLATGGTQFGQAFAAGSGLGMLNAIGDTPAYMLNGLLNGQMLVDMTLPANVTVPVTLPVVGTVASIPFSLAATAHLPLDGLLVPPAPLTATLPPINEFGIPLAPQQTIAFGGTKFSGLLPFLINTMPDQIASAIAWQNTAPH